MNRRAFVTGLGAVLAAPPSVDAQQARVYRIGVVIQGGTYSAAVEGLRQGLKELGLEEGKQVVFLVRDVEGDLNAVEAAARRLEGEKVDLIWALATSTSLAVKRATKTVPIVFYAGTDPVVVGLVASFQKPGGRCTGVAGQFSDLTAKRLELLRDMSPRARRILAIYNPNNPAAQRSIKLMRDTARQLKVELVEASVDEMRAALHAIRPGEVDAIGYVADAMVTSQAELVIETASRATRRQPARPACRAARSLSLRHQPQDRQGARSDDSAIAAAAGGSSD